MSHYSTTYKVYFKGTSFTTLDCQWLYYNLCKSFEHHLLWYTELKIHSFHDEISTIISFN